MNQDSLIARIVEHFRFELTANRELLALGQAKTAALVEHARDRFDEITLKERAVLQRQDEFKRRRQDLLTACGRHLGLPGKDVRLAHLIACADPATRSELEDLQRDLRAVLTDLRRVNDRNMLLMRTSLTLVHDLMDLVAGSEDRVAYDAQGRNRDRVHQRGGLLDIAC